MELFLNGFAVFLLIFCRVTAMFVVAPLFSSRNVPASFKIGFGFIVSVLVFFSYGINQAVVPDAEYILFIIREIIAGVLLGFVVYLFFTIVQTAGAFVDMQMGFGMANVIDPLTGISAPLLGNFKYAITILLFLSMNGHHFMLQALMRSYEWMPLSNDLFARIYDGSIAQFLVQTFAVTFMLAFQLAAPLVVAMFLTDVGLGFLARTAPQFNVFVIGIPLKILVGLLLLGLLMPSLLFLFEHLFSEMFAALEKLFGLIQKTNLP